MITLKTFHYNFDRMHFQALPPLELPGKFAVMLKWNKRVWPKNEFALFELPGSMRIVVREISASPSERDSAENYRLQAQADGSCYVIEMELSLACDGRPEWRTIRLGVPVSFCQERTVYFLVTGGSLQVVIDGEVFNEEFPAGVIRAAVGEPVLANHYVSAFGFSGELELLEKRAEIRELPGSIQYYTPPGFNTWAGDVVVAANDRQFHVLYLYDRRHHGSRWGQGAHYFHHLVSEDLVHWTDLGPVLELTESWQSMGTGSMFYHHGNWHIVFGWHTYRVINPEFTASRLLRDDYLATGVIHPLDCRDLPSGIYPSGADYLVSNDGIHFRHPGRLIHISENPGVFPDSDESLLLYSSDAFGGIKGIWKNDGELELPWRLIDFSFPEESSAVRNSGECPCVFRWNRWVYLLMGFTGFWCSRDGEPRRDLAAEGLDIYDGLCVPMAAAWRQNRFLLCGWIGGIGWGSCLVFRELIQYPDGVLGMKWVRELEPVVHDWFCEISPVSFQEDRGPEAVALPDVRQYLIEMTVSGPCSRGRFAVRFGDHTGGGIEFQLDFFRKRAQWGRFADGGLVPPVQSLREAVADLALQPQGCGLNIKSRNGLHFQTGVFCIENVALPENSWGIRFLVTRVEKMNSTLIDVEIAGRRTMITNAVGLSAGQLEWLVDDPAFRIETCRISGNTLDTPSMCSLRP